MSETITRFSAQTEVANWCRRLGGMYAKDLAAIDESTYDVSPGGAARTVADITSEVCGFNLMVASGIRGETMDMPSDEQKAAFKALFSSKDYAKKAIIESSAALAQAVAEASEEDLASEATAPWGETMTKFALANIAINHILYHDGQLNYLQSLNGDAEMHWFDGG